MKRGRSTKAMTKEEAAWVAAVKHCGCILCARRGFHREENGPLAEAHHLLSGGIRKGHMDTVGLCAWHHRARLIVDRPHAWHRARLGPSLDEGSDPFHEEWGSDESILEEQRSKVAAYIARHGRPSLWREPA